MSKKPTPESQVLNGCYAWSAKPRTAGRLSPEQTQFLADIQSLGGIALVVRSWQELDQALREVGYVSDGPLFEETNAAPYGGV